MRKFYGAVSAICIVALVMITTASNAQTTYSKVYNILSANCQGSGCHSGGPNNAQSGLDFSLPEADVYNVIIGKTPLNPRAAAKGNKIIDPGYPERSFLLRKMAHCSEPDLAIEPAEGAPMPQNRYAIPDSSFEIIRQWIIKAAPQTGNVVDENLIRAYYGGPHVPRLTPPAPPLPCEGFQVHLGPIFFWPGAEMEFLKRYDVKNPTAIEVKGLDNHMNTESHHFILRKFSNINGGNTQDLIVFDSAGFVNPSATPFDQNKDYVMAWQNSVDIELPNGTAYSWGPNTSLDLNYHVKNFDTLPIAVEMYLNVYTQPAGTATKEMKSELINQALFTVRGNDTTVLSYNVFNGNNKSIWSITSHTHKYGRGYKVWLRKPNNDRGDLVYDGNYNFDYTFNQGYFDWHHPPTHTFEPMLYMGNLQSDGSAVAGLVEEATYVSNQPTDVHFGFTTADEMMIIYVQYVDGAYTIPSQGYVNPNCVQVPYVNPCDVPTNADTLVVGSPTTGNLGDTVMVISNGDTSYVIITGVDGPYTFHNGDVVVSSVGGLVYLNGVPVGYGISGLTGIGETASNVSNFTVYPNPFEGHTSIDYLLPEAANVSLEVFNLMGQKVETLVDNEKQSNGGRSYQYTPAKLSSGIYMVKLTVNGVTTVKKISLM